MFAFVMLGLLQQTPDTLRLDAAEALRRAVAAAPALRAAAARDSASQALVRRAGSWRNPVFSVTAENLGAEVQTTGKSGIAGIEGQMIIEQTLTLGGDRGAAISEARAKAGAAGATWAGTDADLRLQAISVIALAERDAANARFASQESVVLRQVAAMMSRRAAEGRSSGGDAALATLEASSAASMAARRGALAAESQAELARVVGAAAGEYVMIDVNRCPAPRPAGPGARPAELVRADYDVAAADAAVAAARAARVPDLRPSAGLRRTQGFSGLWLGLSLDLPIMPSGSASEQAARYQADAAREDRDALVRQVTARRAGADAALEQLDGVAGVFDAQLVADLERAIRSAESRYAAGEGTLVELLITRRARLSLLTEYEEWRAAQRITRARAARLNGVPIDAEMLCDSNGRQLQ
jgi:outer membrane protein, heavy metal efflux system